MIVIHRKQPRICPNCGSDDIGCWTAHERREDEADICGCERCKWQGALNAYGAASIISAALNMVMERCYIFADPRTGEQVLQCILAGDTARAADLLNTDAMVNELCGNQRKADATYEIVGTLYPEERPF